MQRLLSLKKDRRYWGGTGLSTPLPRPDVFVHLAPNYRPRSQGARKTPGAPASSRSRPALASPARTAYRPGAAARGPPTARSPARPPRLRGLCVPATRLEALGAEPARGAEPQILTFPTVSAQRARCQWPLLMEARESALKPAFQAARSDKLAPG